MNENGKRLNYEFNHLAQTLRAAKTYCADIERSTEPAISDIEAACDQTEKMIAVHKGFYQDNEHEFDQMLQQLTMALDVCHDLEKNNRIVNDRESTPDQIEEAEANIDYRRRYFKTHVESAEERLKELYCRGRALAGDWVSVRPETESQKSAGRANN